MKEELSKKTVSALQWLGIYQLTGAVGLAAIILWNLLSASVIPVPIIWIYSIVFLFISYSVFTGILCLKINKHDLSHSLVNQVIQVLGMSFSGFSLNYFSGVYCTVTIIRSDSLDFALGAGLSNFRFEINTDNDIVSFSINLVALLLIFRIDKLMKKVNAERIKNQIDLIGEE